MSLVGVGRIVASQTLFATIQASPAKQCQNVITLAALSALAVPLCLGICLGMGARALDIPISRWEAENGLVSSAVAVHFFGRSGAWFAMLQACTSIAATASAELIGFAVTLNRDLYVRYIHAEASLQDQSTITMKSVWGCGFCVAVISSFMIYADASQNVVFYFAGILMNACVVPLIIAVTTQRNCPGAVVVGTVTGAVGGLFAWGFASVGLEVSATSDVAVTPLDPHQP
jgi:Na+/proline symporter